MTISQEKGEEFAAFGMKGRKGKVVACLRVIIQSYLEESREGKIYNLQENMGDLETFQLMEHSQKQGYLPPQSRPVMITFPIHHTA